MTQKFIKIGANGKRIVKSTAAPIIAIYVPSLDLTWSLVDPGRMNWADAKAWAKKLIACGKKCWRLPTVAEWAAIIDYSRVDPAIDARYLQGFESDWYWTSVADASSPSGYAWFVRLLDGSVGRYGQANRCGVRAVRAGQ